MLSLSPIHTQGGPQSRVWHLLNNPASSWLATLIWLTITTAILLSTVSFITETSLLYYKPTVRGWYKLGWWLVL